MNASTAYISLGFIVVSLLGWQLEKAVVPPLQEKLYTAYVQQATDATVKGDLAAARSWLSDANQLPVPNATSTQLAATIDRLAADPRAERDFMSEHGNTARVTLLDTVLQPYETPKEVLEAAGQLFVRHEDRLAHILLAQAMTADNEYVGTSVMGAYASSLNQ